MEPPIIDLELGKKLAGNNQKIAEEMMILFLKELPGTFHAMQKVYQEQKFNELKRLAHKLHGALCYCGLPRLKSATAALECALDNNESNITPFYIQFEKEVVSLIQEASRLRILQGDS
jgi:two-component system sensor histidine kinase BarA